MTESDSRTMEFDCIFYGLTREGLLYLKRIIKEIYHHFILSYKYTTLQCLNENTSPPFPSQLSSPMWPRSAVQTSTFLRLLHQQRRLVSLLRRVLQHQTDREQLWTQSGKICSNGWQKPQTVTKNTGSFTFVFVVYVYRNRK